MEKIAREDQGFIEIEKEAGWFFQGAKVRKNKTDHTLSHLFIQQPI